MRTVLDIIQRAATFLGQKGVINPKRSAEEVIADSLGVKRLDLYLMFDRPLQEQELVAAREAIQRRGRREPTAYIAGRVSFAGVELEVNPAVLIPRSETEILVEHIKKTLNEPEGTLLDLCCGSGAIGLALKKAFPKLNVVLSDVSKEALAVARGNADRNGLEVTFMEGDLEMVACNYFVCNPPYIAEGEVASLEVEVREFEPLLALIGGRTGLEFYIRVAKKLGDFLKPRGKGWMEMGYAQRGAIKTLFSHASFRCHFEKDWSGHDRFFFLDKD